MLPSKNSQRCTCGSNVHLTVHSFCTKWDLNLDFSETKVLCKEFGVN